jgi:hypothetical protein
MIWPNFFVVGGQRAGTTSLYEYLRRIPEVYMSAVKEPYYFAPNFPSNPYIRRIAARDEYLSLFRNTRGERLIGEASPLYLWDVESPVLIHKVVPDARIIMILRDPIERAFSSYLLSVQWGYETRPFLDALVVDYNNSKNGHSRLLCTLI